MSLADISIRPAGRDDLAAVRALLVETWHDTYDALLGPDKVTAITDSWHSLEALSRQIGVADTSFLVALDGETIVGHALADARQAPALIVNRLYVLPRAQRRGIGARLLADIVARHPQCSVMRLAVEADNEKGLGFYRRLGFEPVGEFVEEGIAHLRMEKVVSPRT